MMFSMRHSGLASLFVVATTVLLACEKRSPPGASGAPTVASTAASAPSAPIASAPSSSPSPRLAPTATGSASSVPRAESAEDDPKLSFFDNRLKNAKAGEAELVSVRVWHCGVSCTCPPPCIEVVAAGVTGPWVDVLDANGTPLVLADWASADITARVTGKTRKAKGPSPEAHTLVELSLVGAPTLRNASAGGPDFDEAPMKVTLRGDLAAKTVARVSDDRPYLVVAGSFPATEAHPEASALLKKMYDAGIADAELYDSRAFVGLTCCYDVVVGGRFADAKAAEARKKEVASKVHVGAYVKKGF